MLIEQFTEGQTVYKIKKTGNLITVIEVYNCYIQQVLDLYYVNTYNYDTGNFIGLLSECFSTKEEAIDNYKKAILASIKFHEDSINECRKLLLSDIFGNNIHDLVYYISSKYKDTSKQLSLFELNLILYYAQVKCLTEYGTVLFNEQISLSEDTYEDDMWHLSISKVYYVDDTTSKNELTEKNKIIIDSVLEELKDKSFTELWNKTELEISIFNGNSIFIDAELMKSYYSMRNNDSNNKLHSIINYIIIKRNDISLNRLYSLLYFCQSYSLVNYNNVLFNEDITFGDDEEIIISDVSKINLSLPVKFDLSETDVDIISTTLNFYEDISDKELSHTIYEDLYKYMDTLKTGTIIDLELMKSYYNGD